MGPTFKLLRKMYNTLLSRQQTLKLRKYQTFESTVFIHALLDSPNEFLLGIERYALSVIFSACYGVRLMELNHPIMNEFFTVWQEMLKCT